MIDIRKLHQQQEENEQQQHHIYEKILYKCHHRIITVSQKGDTFSFLLLLLNLSLECPNIIHSNVAILSLKIS